MPRATPLILADNGRPFAAVCVSPSPSAPEEYAADELRRHLSLMCGEGTYPWSHALMRSHGRASGEGPAIRLNDIEAAEAAGIRVDELALGPEAFHLETRGSDLHILAQNPRGLLYGVYEVLETLGCRWYTPSVARIPRASRLVLPPLRRTCAPAFEFRDLWMWEAYDPAWWVRNRLNGFQCQVPDYMGGHMSYGMFVHTFGSLLPVGEFFEKHPEYFSLVGGARRREGGQMCLSHPAVLKIVTERLRQRMRADRKSTIFSVSQNDCLGACECERCRAIAAEEGSESGPLLRFVNAVAAAVEQEFPGALIDTLAYQYTLDPPRVTRPRPNVRVRLCPINCCQGHPFGACAHPESRRFLKALKGWSRIAGQMYIWHYATDFANYPLPMPDYDELHADLNLYRRFGVYGVFVQGGGEEGGGAETMALRAYVLSKLMWNPRLPLWPLIDEFLGAYYGKAAPHVRRYLDVFHRRVRRDRNLHPSLYDPPSGPLYAEQTVAPADRALARGEGLVEGAERLRVQLLRTGLAYARLRRKTARPFRIAGSRYAAPGGGRDAAALDRMVAVWRTAGVRRIREGAPSETTLHQFRMLYRSHPVIWLRAHGQRLAIAPTLGGRILEWHAGGRQWLAAPDPDNRWTPYPLSGGYAEYAICGLYDFRGFSEEYASERTGDAVTLTAEIPGGLRVARRIRLCASGVDIRSLVRNLQARPVTVTWGGSLQLASAQDSELHFAAADGTRHSRAWDALPGSLEKAVTFEGGAAPKGRWNVRLAERSLTHRFQGAVTRAIVGRTVARGTLALDLRTDPQTLAPGAALRVSQTLRIVRRET